MKILLTGHYDKNYNRTRIITDGLRGLGVELIECPLAKKEKDAKKLIMETGQLADAIFMPAFTHTDVRFVKKIFPYKPLVFDPLISRYLTKVYDYKLVWKYSPRALKNYLKDYLSFSACDALIADTEAHKKYYVRTFGIPSQKTHVVPVGAPTSLFHPMPKRESTYFTVGFYGNFVPLQGTQNIVRAARLLERHADIRFVLIGSGHDMPLAMQEAKGLTNISFVGQVAYEELNEYLSLFDVCLGIFGNTPKADLVIPNKIFHYAACQRPIITKKTSAIEEIFSDQTNIMLCGTEPKVIAQQILLAKELPDIGLGIAKAGYELVRSKYNETEIAKAVLAIFHSL